MKPFVVAITGASGVLYGVRLVKQLIHSKKAVELIISDTARIVLKEELGINIASDYSTNEICKAFDISSGSRLCVHSPKDFTASVASGSYPVEAMIIIPCTMGTLGAIASGVCQNLIHRTAGCTIKENRKLILVPRETPLSAIHLENMLKLSRIGVRIVPAMPAFYSGVKNVGDIIDFMVGRVMDQLGISHMLYPRWVGSTSFSAKKTYCE